MLHFRPFDDGTAAEEIGSLLREDDLFVSTNQRLFFSSLQAISRDQNIKKWDFEAKTIKSAKTEGPWQPYEDAGIPLCHGDVTTARNLTPSLELLECSLLLTCIS